MKVLYLILLVFVTIFSGYELYKYYKTKDSQIHQLSWLQGSWSNHSDSGTFIETWYKKNDSMLTGKSYFIMRKDTLFSENITIEYRNGQLCYIPVVKGQNGDLPVIFRLKSINNGEFVFENPTHDFPQRIIYKNAGNDSLNAWIEGAEKGVFRKELFPMKKIK